MEPRTNRPYRSNLITPPDTQNNATLCCVTHQVGGRKSRPLGRCFGVVVALADDDRPSRLREDLGVFRSLASLPFLVGDAVTAAAAATVAIVPSVASLEPDCLPSFAPWVMK